MNTSKKISWGADNLVYLSACILTFGMVYILKVVIMKAIIDAKEIQK